jgi:hypothetical protein
MLFDPKKQITKPSQCPDCEIDTDFLLSQAASEVFLSTVLERHLFACPNCGRLGYKTVLRPKELVRFEAA